MKILLDTHIFLWFIAIGGIVLLYWVLYRNCDIIISYAANLLLAKINLSATVLA
jgi:PIN domain nuclease of toxin-antitoxin system